MPPVPLRGLELNGQSPQLGFPAEVYADGPRYAATPFLKAGAG